MRGRGSCGRLTGRVFGPALYALGWAALIGVFSAGSVDPAGAQVTASTFRHDRHESLSCQECHTMQPGHGSLLVRDIGDCRNCHHTRERSGRDCTDCHEVAALRDAVYPQVRVLTLSVRDGPVVREIPFSHAPHLDRACTECHVGGRVLGPPSVDCNRCHAEHHVQTNPGCWSCHRQPREGAHTVQVHQSCTGAGCHADGPIQAPPTTRVGCLWCHEDRADHEPGARCVDCHIVRSPQASYLSPGPPIR